ncbi:MAG: ANTAR domain-containing response regulator [Acutalibacteraceae bacterium]
MSLKERVYSVLVVSSAENFNKSLYELLPPAKYSPVDTVSNVNAAKRIIVEKTYDFILINAPLPDEFGSRFAIDASTIKNSIVLLLVRSDDYAATFDKVAEHGVFILSKPTSKPAVINALAWMATARERFRKQENKTHSLEDKMAEIKIVNRAKLLLISEMHMDESQAHRYIEKQAMDRCITRKVVAEEIVKTYS